MKAHKRSHGQTVTCAGHEWLYAPYGIKDETIDQILELTAKGEGPFEVIQWNEYKGTVIFRNGQWIEAPRVVTQVPKVVTATTPQKTLAELDPDACGIPYAEWKAQELNRIFLERGAMGKPGEITAATVVDGLEKEAQRHR